MKKRTTQVTVMVQFEQVIDIPLEIQRDEDAIYELADEMIGSAEMLTNLTDSGIISQVDVHEYEEKYENLEEG